MTYEKPEVEATAEPARLDQEPSARPLDRIASYLSGLPRDVVVDIALIAALGLLLAIFGIASSGREFITANIVQIVDSGAILGLVTIGEVIVMIAGALDISVGSNAGLVTAVVAEVMLHTHLPLGVAIVVGLLAGSLAGAFNGFVVAYLRISAVIATLATFSAFSGVALLLTNGNEVGVTSTFLASLGTGSVAGVPYLVIIFLVVTALAIVAMRFTLQGHNVYAVGGSDTASRLAGIRVSRYLLGVFVVSGFCAAIAGIMLLGQTGTAQPTEGSVGLELTAITAVLLGGTGLTGGTGTVLGAFLGVMVLSTLDNGLLLVGVQAFWQQVATGALLLIGVILQDVGGHRSRWQMLRAARRRINPEELLSWEDGQ
ncbi:MAG TPA: ABC transporter permease [Solirubrobacteraceae bacterium]|jgi:ribose transport system permease protein|nr:ABC transporter permease [Solirubrobacteraceae bacterium]